MDAQPWSLNWYRLAADAVLVVHFAVVLFVIVGLVATVVGGILKWRWVRNRWFRGLHLLAIVQIAGQAIGGITCPLTDWEMRLRVLGGQRAYAETFVAHWLGQILFVEGLPAWVFTAAYASFAVLVVGALWWVPVNWSPKRPVRRV